MKRWPVAGAMIAVLAFLASCGGSDDEAAREGDGESPKNDAVVQADSLTLRLSREKDRFRIEFEVPRVEYGAGEGTYVVFVPESSLRKAVTITGASRRSVVRRSSGSYKAPTQARPILRKLTLSVRVLAAAAQGGAVLGSLELANSLTGLGPITDPSQLPEIALALGQKYVDAVGEANVQSQPFGEFLSILSGRQPGVLLLSGQRYWIELETAEPAETLGLDVKIQFVRSNVLPSGLPMQQVLTRLLLGHKHHGKQIAFPEELSASLPPIEKGGEDDEAALLDPWCRTEDEPVASQPKAVQEAATPGGRTLIHPDLADALAQAKRRGKLLLVDFYGGWCPWCVRMDQVLADPGVQAILNQSFRYHKLDIGRFDRHHDCIQRYGVRGIPHIIVFKPDGSVKTAKGGYQPVATFKRFLEKAAR